MVKAPKPLAGRRVLDLTNVLAGPFCCHQLAHMGAQIIKVERPGRGDLARQLGADPHLNRRNMGISFLAQNAGKTSVTLNLKHKEGKALLKRLVATADIVVENFRPGVMDRLGVGYEALREVKPDLIYCAISGFGQDGPWVDRPAYDQIVQGVAGVMSITGDGRSGPMRVGFPVADTIGGLTAAFAIAAALDNRGQGAFIDVSMLEATIATMGWVVSNYLVGGAEPAAHGNENPTSAPSGAFAAADGLLNIAANRDEQWIELARHLGREDLLRRPEFSTREARKMNRVELKAELEKTLRARPARDWAQGLNAAGVPAGAVMSVAEILSHPQIAGRGMLATFEDVPGAGRDVTLVRTGIRIDGKPLAVKTPPPELGADNDKVYKAVGLSTDQISRLKKEGVI